MEKTYNCRIKEGSAAASLALGAFFGFKERPNGLDGISQLTADD